MAMTTSSGCCMEMMTQSSSSIMPWTCWRGWTITCPTSSRIISGFLTNLVRTLYLVSILFSAGKAACLTSTHSLSLASKHPPLAPLRLLKLPHLPSLPHTPLSAGLSEHAGNGGRGGGTNIFASFSKSAMQTDNRFRSFMFLSLTGD